jgi:hypothetical protein
MFASPLSLGTNRLGVQHTPIPRRPARRVETPLGVANLMATHDLFRAKEFGTRVGIMRHKTMVGPLIAVKFGDHTHRLTSEVVAMAIHRPNPPICRMDPTDH